MAYEYLDHPAPVGGGIDFRRTAPDDDPARYVTPARLVEQGIAFAYVQADSVTEAQALNSRGLQLGTDTPPYDPDPTAGMRGWYPFMDDLETLSERADGTVIIIDRAGDLFVDPASWAFELITLWGLQLPGWQRRKLPCHLVFQMDADPAVAAIYNQPA